MGANPNLMQICAGLTGCAMRSAAWATKSTSVQS